MPRTVRRLCTCASSALTRSIANIRMSHSEIFSIPCNKCPWSARTRWAPQPFTDWIFNLKLSITNSAELPILRQICHFDLLLERVCQLQWQSSHPLLPAMSRQQAQQSPRCGSHCPPESASSLANGPGDAIVYGGGDCQFVARGQTD